MSWDLKCTITVDENEIKELADGLGSKYATTIGELYKENNELRGKNDILESRLRATEPLEKFYRHRIETLLSENKLLKEAKKGLLLQLKTVCANYGTDCYCRWYTKGGCKGMNSFTCTLFNTIKKYDREEGDYE